VWAYPAICLTCDRDFCLRAARNFADVPGVRLLRILAACRGPLFLASETPRRIRKHASPSPRSRRGALLPTRTQMIGALGRNATVRIILLTLIGAPLITGSSGARAETPSPGVERSARITLNIPSQPLADAIYAYTAATGIEALAAGAILSDRRSSEVHGTLTADEALQALLRGTGLIRFFHADAGASASGCCADDRYAVGCPIPSYASQDVINYYKAALANEVAYVRLSGAAW